MKTPVPRSLLDPVVKYFKPQRVILFGSRARGEAGPDSDIDLLVILDDDAPPEKFTWQARHAARGGYRPDADVFPMHAESFERERLIAGTLAAEADADGVVVYGPPKGVRPMKRADPHARWEVVERWLAAAAMDRQIVAACLVSEPPVPAGAAFHCQQALEKLLKGFLVLAGKRFRRTHSLEKLGAEVAENFPETAEIAAPAAAWTDWGVVFRYPGDEAPPPAPPDERELRRALQVIDRLAGRLREKAPNR
jgi:HEPN domain-containing protein